MKIMSPNVDIAIWWDSLPTRADNKLLPLPSELPYSVIIAVLMTREKVKYVCIVIFLCPFLLQRSPVPTILNYQSKII